MISIPGSYKWRFSSRILLPIILTVTSIGLLVTGLMLFAARETDAVSREREERLVSHVISEQFTKISRDQESIAIWDDAVEKTKFDFDLEWIDVNLGIWMYDYFGHDRTFILSDGDRSIYAMRDGIGREPSDFTNARTALAPLIVRLREILRQPDPNAEQTPRVADLVIVEGRPAIASVMPLTSDSGDIAQEPGSEYLHVSVRFIDGNFLQAIMRQYVLRGARFAWNEDPDSDEAAYPLTRNSGLVLGYFVWQPDRPGWSFLRRTAPVLAGALLLVAAIIGFLVRRLRRASAELQASEAHAHHLAFHDPLTGLPNRALFDDRLDRALIEMRRQGSSLAVLYCDLDRFKNVNDTLGHPAGDHLIRELAGRLGELVRSTDCVSRLGGDEFAIIQTGVSGPEDATSLCKRIIDTVAMPFELVGSSAFVGVSIGVAIAPEAGLDRAELVRKADIALYRAKLDGRNRFCVFREDLDIFIQRRRAIEQELREALLEGDQFRLVYQPLFAAVNSSVVGVEALLRWQHPRHGLISPTSFISIAEESGLIHAIGDWVLREACSAAQRWPFHCISVNASPVQFRSPSFAAKVLQILQENGLEPNRLQLEITETALLDSVELSTLTLSTLRAAGVRIALDDFGTGYSSLNYLRKYSVDKIKIDRSFIHNLNSDDASDAIVKAMVDLARALGMTVTAEGVETDKQLDFLKSIGCNEIQGFLLSQPLQREQIDRLLGAAEPFAPRKEASAAA